MCIDINTEKALLGRGWATSNHQDREIDTKGQQSCSRASYETEEPTLLIAAEISALDAARPVERTANAIRDLTSFPVPLKSKCWNTSVERREEGKRAEADRKIFRIRRKYRCIRVFVRGFSLNF